MTGSGSSIKDRLPAALSRWRRRDEEQDRGTWRGVREIAGNLKAPVRETRRALRELADAGQIERSEVSNGVFWRAPT